MSDSANETRLWAMDSLCRSARTLFSENEPKPDVFPQQDGLNGWPFVVTAYNGIELALKALLAAEALGLSDDEIQRRWRELGHDIHEAYNHLSDGAKAHVEVHYAEHRSLFNYDSGDIPTGTAGEFIEHISDKTDNGQGGLLRWRYAPLEDMEGVPTTSIWTMYEVWDAVCCCLEHMEYPDRCRRVSARLSFTLSDKIIMECSLGGLPDDWDISEVNSWVNSKGVGGLGVLVDLLGCVYREALHEVDLSEPMRGILGASAAAELRRLKDGPVEMDERQLINRIAQAAGRLAAEPDPETGACLFKDLPAPTGPFETSNEDDSGVKILVEDVCVGTRFRIPGLGRIPWTVASEAGRTVARSTLPGVVECTAEPDAEGCLLSGNHPDGTAIATLGELVWEATSVGAVEQGGKLLGERWLEASSNPHHLKVRVADKQEVVEINGHISFGLYRSDDPDTVPESGRLYYFQFGAVSHIDRPYREIKVTATSLRMLSEAGFRYHVGNSSFAMAHIEGPDDEPRQLEPDDRIFRRPVVLLTGACTIAQAKQATEEVVRLLDPTISEDATLQFANFDGHGWRVSVVESNRWMPTHHVGQIYSPQIIPLRFP